MMTRKQADLWAQNRIRALLANPLLRLSMQSAGEAADAMTALTGKVWLVKRCEQAHSFYWRVYETETDAINQPTGNRNIGGSI